jgi:hypothetical protein
MLTLLMVTPALAGENPYLAVVGNDIDANGFYLSPTYEQFLFDQELIGVPVQGEWFGSNQAIIQPEICDTSGAVTGTQNAPSFKFTGNLNARVGAGSYGTYSWYIRLPVKPSGEINLCFQCGVLKPNAFAFKGFLSVLTCAAETGEYYDQAGGICSRATVYGGMNPVNPLALPLIEAKAVHGPHATYDWPSFHLTAFRNPGTYDGRFSGGMVNDEAKQVLDSTNASRILLKSCMDKCVVVKMPVEGQYNALGELEQDLMPGDVIVVWMHIPKCNTVDIYCHAESLKVMGIGVDPF